MLHIINLIFSGCKALLRESGRVVSSGVARFEERSRRGLTAFPAGLIDLAALFAGAFGKRGAGSLSPILLSLAIILLFLLLR